FLDGLMEYRRSRGRPGVSVAWGPWDGSGGGMTGGLSEADVRRMSRTGVTPLAPKAALALLDAAVRGRPPVVVAAQWDLSGLAGAPGTDAVPHLLRDLRPDAGPPDGGPLPAGSLAAGASAAPDGLLAMVRAELAGVLGHRSAAVIDPQRPFDETGLDSLTTVELRNRIMRRTGVRLPATFIYDWLTPADLVAHLGAELQDAATPAGTEGGASWE
ncbi:MAG TPA: beta-ketoacyl reductase, partial [Streptosporangiaceae bacterium]|nr:beta-ketoacyl reductase [Streptosporangiaceae bacterium]